MLTRRFVLAAAAVTAVSAALPRVPLAAVPPAATTPVAWVVGTPGEFDWQVVRAVSHEEAVLEWLAEKGYGTVCEEPDEGAECTCEFCLHQGAESQRVEGFDSIANPSPGDWIRAGIGHICCRCDYECGPWNGAQAIGDEAVCDDCLTTEERDADEDEASDD